MRLIQLSFLPVLLMSFGSCGLLGEKAPAKRSIALSEETGCLDELGARMDAFLAGTISEPVWIETWNCVEDTLDKFETLVRPSDARGFTESDILGLIKTFLVKKKPVTAKFVHATFAAKASLFGGDARFFSKTEIGKFRQLIALIRSDTPSFIPLLRQRKENPRADQLRPLVRKIAEFGERFAQRLSPENNPTLDRTMLMQFMAELGKMSVSGTEETYSAWGAFFLETKRILVRGPDDGIAGSDWKELIRVGSEFGSVIVGLFSVNSGEPEFQLELAETARLAVEKILTRWNGKVPFSELEKLVDAAPAELLPTRAEEFRSGMVCAFRRRFSTVDPESRCSAYPECPKEGCRPAVARILLSGVEDGIDAAAIDTIYDIYHTGTQAKIHLEGILGGIKEELSPSDFVKSADEYAAGLPEKTVSEVTRLKRIAMNYPGLHPEGSAEMNFASIANHSKENLVRFSFFEAISEKLLQAYGSKKIPLEGTVKDLYFLTKDFEMLLLSFSMIHPHKTNMHAKRFREANLFTIPGNGDTTMDLKETTNYLAYLMSISKLSKRIQNTIFKDDPVTGRPAPCKAVGTDSCLQLPQYSIQCFRDHFYSNLEEFWRGFPGLVDDLSDMTVAQREKLMKSYEAAAKLSGQYDATDVSGYDVDSYAGIPHFIEGLMKKFDYHGGKEDGYLDRTEIDARVWPTFKTEFKSLTNLPGWGLLDWVNKPLFIYLLKNGGLPFKCQASPKIGEIAQFSLWMATGGHKSSFEIRRERMFKVFEELSKPVLPGCKGYVPPAVCKGTGESSRAQTMNLGGNETELSLEMQLLLEGAVSDEEKKELTQ